MARSPWVAARRRIGRSTIPLLTVALAAGACTATPSGSDQTALSACAADRPVTETISIESAVYGGSDRVLVHQPPCPAGPVEVLYLLHGAGADESQWTDVGVIEAADRLREETGHDVVLVIPDAAAAYRCARGCERDMAAHLLDEIEPVLGRAGLSVDRRAVGGISRGARLALGAASARPDAFVAAGGHSAARVEPTTFEVLAGDDLPIWLDVGADDPLAPEVADLAAILDTGTRVLVHEVSPGGHDRGYWRAHTPDYLRWYGEQLAS